MAAKNKKMTLTLKFESDTEEGKELEQYVHKLANKLMVLGAKDVSVTIA